MSGSEKPSRDHRPVPRWLDLVDIATGEIVGQLSSSGAVITAHPQVAERLDAAFGRELMVRDGEVVAELGICYADVESLPPGSPDHRALVLRNLAALTGYLPQPRSTPPSDDGAHPDEAPSYLGRDGD